MECTLGETAWERQKLVVTMRIMQCCVYFDMHDPLRGDWIQCVCTCWLYKGCKVHM